MAKALLPHGLDELSYGVEVLLTGCRNKRERESVAKLVINEISGVYNQPPAVAAFVQAVRRFAVSGTSPQHVRSAYIAFLEQVGPIVGMQDYAVTSGRKGAKASAERARADSAKEIKAAVERLRKVKEDEFPYRNVQRLAKALHATMLPGIKVATLRRWLERLPDLPQHVDSLPPKLKLRE